MSARSAWHITLFEPYGSHGSCVLNQGTTLQVAEKLMLCIRAGCGKTHALYQGRLRKNSCFVSGHDFTGCGKMSFRLGFKFPLELAARFFGRF
jgi:hypothetical protein